MIGFFDSGVGGLTVWREVNKRIPQFSTVYFGDNKNAPYGDLSKEEILKLTKKGVEFLWGHGASLVILACNTASAIALPYIQNNLPHGKKVLGIITPTVEVLSSLSADNIGILATIATVQSKIYEQKLAENKCLSRITAHACPSWVMLAETGQKKRATKIIASDVSRLLEKSGRPDVVLLACTHYPVFYNEVIANLPAGIKVLSQGELVADKLIEYISRHQELSFDRQGEHLFYTSGDPIAVENIAAGIIAEPIRFKKAELD
ncbi:glutamate racemase [Candidatus Parcubacteria bacterium]|nr:MAG: glutamate racemase [Candidatus Parcubacteria bacterium]